MAKAAIFAANEHRRRNVAAAEVDIQSPHIGRPGVLRTSSNRRIIKAPGISVQCDVRDGREQEKAADRKMG